jgi:hypothetical protein
VPTNLTKTPCVLHTTITVDTGTSLLTVPPANFAVLSKAIGNVAADCSNKKQLPTIACR